MTVAEGTRSTARPGNPQGGSSVSAPHLTIASRSFAPQVSGSAVLLANLLSGYPGPVNALAGATRYSKADQGFAAPCPTTTLLPSQVRSLVFDFLGRRYPDAISKLLAGLMANEMRAAGTQVVFGVFPFHAFSVASYLAAQRLKLPYYAHMHDLWQENVPPGTALHAFVSHWEPIILRGATRVLSMTEAMQAHYLRRYGLQSELLPHTVPEADLQKMPAGILPAAGGNPQVLFVGSVSRPMNHDALRVLAAASELLPPEYELIFCTPQMELLPSLGIKSSRLQAKFVSRAEVQQMQSRAHVLIAPLSHKNGSPDEVRTVFSTKLLEYLVAGRPILVFAPADSHHAQSASEKGWAQVVSEDSPAALAEGIVKVVEDRALAAGLVNGALEEARSRAAGAHAERLLEWVQQDARR